MFLHPLSMVSQWSLTGYELIENVIIPLFRCLGADSRLFQQVMRHVTTDDSRTRRVSSSSSTPKMDLDELAKATGIVVANSFGVAKRLQEWVRLDDALGKEEKGER